MSTPSALNPAPSVKPGSLCSGSPVDCVVAAMTVLFAEGPGPDLVLAGINDGRNVGEDIAYSGTMAIGR